jgi:hypothetical protein
MVYDSLDPSPFYTEKDGDHYLDELMFIDMGLTEEEKQNLPSETILPQPQTQAFGSRPQ